MGRTRLPTHLASLSMREGLSESSVQRVSRKEVSDFEGALRDHYIVTQPDN